MLTTDHTSAFANWFSRAFPGSPVPPLPKHPEDLGLTQQMALRADNPALFQNLFGNSGQGMGVMPADTTTRRANGQLEPRDIPHLRAAGLELEAQQLEQAAALMQDQRVTSQTDDSRRQYEAAKAEADRWAELSLLERLCEAPLPQEVVIENRRRWGVSGK